MDRWVAFFSTPQHTPFGDPFLSGPPISQDNLGQGNCVAEGFLGTPAYMNLYNEVTHYSGV